MEPKTQENSAVDSSNTQIIYANYKIRTILVGEELWFCALDVCELLGHKNNRQATSNERIGKENKKKYGELIQKTNVHNLDVAQIEKKLMFINEVALGMLASTSRVPCAIKFQKWIFGEVHHIRVFYTSSSEVITKIDHGEGYFYANKKKAEDLTRQYFSENISIRLYNYGQFFDNYIF